MLSFLSREAINTVFNRVFVPAIIILFIAMLISAFNIYIKKFLKYLFITYNLVDFLNRVHN